MTCYLGADDISGVQVLAIKVYEPPVPTSSKGKPLIWRIKYTTDDPGHKFVYDTIFVSHGNVATGWRWNRKPKMFDKINVSVVQKGKSKTKFCIVKGEVL